MIFPLKCVIFQLAYLHARGCANLVLLSKPVTFGGKVQLACTAYETEIPLDTQYSRSWSGGPDNKLLCKDGISADVSKYKEVLGEDYSQYILEIESFSESDVDCEYKCVFGVDTTRTTLKLNEKDYEYIPGKDTTVVTSSLQNGHLNVNIFFVKVWPTPVCEVIFERINFGKRMEMSKRKNGKLYSANISLKHVFRSDFCSGDMLISCKIGTKTIEVHRKQFNTCPVNVKNRNRNVISEKALTTLIIAVSMFVVMVCIILLAVLLKQKGYITSMFEVLFGYPSSAFIGISTLKKSYIRYVPPQQHPV
ncbi:uncharacterized protein LOC127711535 [Mytilus californianus]|uniref:uncharacterized protein LOC127711535 n=1 Tax=Mytilus californianus TaxID=6549 RepID=UPI00224780C2|nr:uncharacterized protein LOC127711535 [Mytilus californianus]